jgi:hypothetical protein
MTVSVATAPDGLDPDDLVRSHGAQAALAAVECAADLPTFLVDEARRNYPVATLEGKLAALEMVLQHLSHLPNSVARTEIMSKVADGLSIEDALFRQELRRVASERRREVRAPAAATTAGTRRLTHAEEVVVRFLGGRVNAADATDAETAELVATLESVGAAHLGELGGVLVRRWCEAYRRGERWDLRRIAESAPEEASAEILALAFAPGDEPGAAEARGAVAAMHGRVLGRRLREVQEEIERTADPAARSRLMLEKVSLAREMQGLGTAEAGAAAGPVHGGGR